MIVIWSNKANGEMEWHIGKYILKGFKGKEIIFSMCEIN